MSYRLIVRAEAEADITEAALWYEGREAGLGLELTAEIRGAVGRAVERPLTCLRFRKTSRSPPDPLPGDFPIESSSLCEPTR